ncbi:MAG TPA: metal ABC transporter substrate-binding protein [Spirochaetota bacterium]|nr:metal ABC transporter substrate-binding protein [Spirochaetota bacterium]HOM38502.1 metal ABC transporter substrate-binding protein [Spirochaetota bacterium]HPQ49042.1 metal ABC transporter substrate-binding protein [Spirochaetota bacterium]
MKKKYAIIVLILLISIFIITCKNENRQYDIITSIIPIKLIINEITGNSVDSYPIVKEEPHHYTPTLDDIKIITESKLYFLIGAPNLEAEIIIDSIVKDKKVNKINLFSNLKPIRIDNSENINPHLWLSFENSIIIAESISLELIKLYPEKKEIIELNLEKFKKEINLIKNNILQVVTELKNYNIIQIHPAWDYIFKEIGVDVITLSTGEIHSISIKDIENLKKYFDKNKKTVIISSAEFKGELPSELLKISDKIIELDPIGTEYNSFIELIKKNIQNIKNIVK